MVKQLILKNARIVSIEKIIDYGWLAIKDGKIFAMQEGEFFNCDASKNKLIIIDCHNKTIIPGFIDIHVHGGYSYDFIDETKSLKTSLDGFASSVVKEGVTRFCCATVSAKKTKLDAFFIN